MHRRALPLGGLLIALLSLPAAPGRPQGLQLDWAGDVRLGEATSWPGEGTYWQVRDRPAFVEVQLATRQRAELLLGEHLGLEAHYEAILSAGDQEGAEQALERLYPGLLSGVLAPAGFPSDDLRLLGLSGRLENDRYTVYHRLDRLALSLRAPWGLLRAGRQAVTWGNGLFFNPMDLFGSFSPAELDREYKTGEDLLYATLAPPEGAMVEAAYAPRRDPVGGQVEWWARSTLAGRLRTSLGSVELDVVGASHYLDPVFGLGGAANLGDSVLRVDAVWTVPHDASTPEGFLSAAANLDRSWTWWGRNFYGALELYGNGLGKADCEEALLDPLIVERFTRGDLYTLGRFYAGGQLRIELHPLLNLTLAAVANLDDASGLLLPRLEWEGAPSLKVMLEGMVGFGRAGTEFGGFAVPGTGFTHKSLDQVSVRLSLYF